MILCVCSSRLRAFMARRQRHRGQATLEIIPSLLMFTGMFAAICGLCVYLFLQNMVITAAREGARFAALNTSLGVSTTQAAGIASVKNEVQSILLSTTGQTVGSNNITVTPPTGTVGSRKVSVAVNFSLPNPIPIPDFGAAFDGDPNTTTSRLFETIPLSAAATMRYEE
jgi:hypothetical protein